MFKLLILFILLLFPSLVSAMGETESMICKKGIVSPGDSMYAVTQKCGEPATKQSVYGVYNYAGKRYHVSEQWTYDFGPNEFVYIVIFNGNTVSLLYSTKEYGTKH